MTEEKNESMIERAADAVRNTAQATTDYVQNAFTNAAEGTRNLFNRTQDAAQKAANQGTNEQNDTNE